MPFPTGTAAFGARFGNDAALSPAFRAGSDISKTSEDAGFDLFDLSAAVTIGTPLRLAAGFAAGTLTLAAIFAADKGDFFFTTKSGFFQCQADINLQRRAFSGAWRAPAALPPKKASKISPKPMSKPSDSWPKRLTLPVCPKRS